MNKTIFKMAVKNLFANKAKMIITLSLIGIGTFLVILGFGILNFSLQQTQDVCISDFSGDVLITGKPEKDTIMVQLLGVFQTVSVSMDRPKVPYLTPFEKVRSKVESLPEVRGLTNSVFASGMLKPVDLPDSWEPEDKNRSSFPYLQILGIEPESYKNLFDTIKIYEGEFPKSSNGKFAMLPRDRKERFEDYYGRTLKLGDEILISSFAGKARQQKVIITGFFDYAHPDTAIDGIAYFDVDTTRILADMTLGARTAAAIPDSVDLSLSEKSEDELFSDDFDSDIIDTAASSNTKIDYENLLGSTELRDQLNLADNEAWHHIVIKLKDSSKTQSVIKTLNDWFKEEGINAQALDWTLGMAMYYGAIEGTRTLFITMLVILSVVVLIVIMNTLVVAVMQRSSEIGTMRAIGAKKGFVRKIFFAESFFMSCVGVIIGLVLALIGAAVVNAFNIRVGEILAAMFGGKQIRVSISAVSALWTMAAMLLAGLAANWYPVRLALKISPLEAINR
ncbi:ABC transporter permease [Treponema sp. OMZ 788]|uniref:ABC transporter permease n=1 Tax=Treponema sp. OMZ 788 TaxID=2563664 RepID=UPI0020A2BD1C|nr:ABC transporter permease [Treponema sp. OMZ 788]UTC65718.1 ABC transporter permease [Treponema sp. OMZ 788]